MVCLQFVIVVFPDHTHFQFFITSGPDVVLWLSLNSMTLYHDRASKFEEMT